MTRIKHAFVFSIAASTGCLVGAGHAAAAKIQVGNCIASAVSFSTIQGAVSASPAGSTIEVCPGTYPEQVSINKNLALKGVTSANEGASVITVPNGGLVANAASLASGRPIAAQILVTGAAAVTISGLTVDGTGNGIADCNVNPIGIYYSNSSGTISLNSVMNQALTPSLNGCQSGLGIFVQSGSSGSSTVSILNNNVQGYQKNGITANEVGTSATITGNTVIGQGPTTGAAENSIQIAFGAVGKITSNVVGDDVWAPDTFGDTGNAAAGILVYASPAVTVTSNIVSNTQFGIAVFGDPTDGSADGASVQNNRVQLTRLFDGIDICANGSIVKSNNVNGSDEAGIHLDDSCTGAAGSTVSGNSINSACAGILSGPPIGSNSTAPNKYASVGTLRLFGSNQCPATPAPSLIHNAGRSKASTGHKPAASRG